MPDFLIRGLADMSVLRSLVIAGGLAGAGICLVLLLIPVRHFTPRWLRRALPLRLRRFGLRVAQYAALRWVALVDWLSAPVGTPSSSPSSAPKKGAHHA